VIGYDRPMTRRALLLVPAILLVLLIPTSAAATPADDAATRNALTMGWYGQGRDRTGPGQPGIDPFATFPLMPNGQRADLQAVDARDADADLRRRLRQLAGTPTTPLKILAAGDSITVGGNSIDHKGYRGYLADLLDRRDIVATLTLAGGNGLGLPAVASAVTAALPTVQPNIVLINVGTNDAYGPPGPAWAAQLGALVDAILASSPTVRVVVSKLSYTDVIWHPSMAANEQTINGYVASVHAARQAGGRVALADMSVIPSSWLSDGPGLHPRDPGYLWMARIWLDAITPWLP
jgi:lysophospholipase L1-like esterase